MKLLIAGSRSISNYFLVMGAVDQCVDLSEVEEIVHGGAAGVDSMAIEVAGELGVTGKVFPADWEQFGKAAGHIRNREMAEYADVLVAVWDGESPGTRNMIKHMQKMGKPTYVVTIKEVHDE
jgi:uncharacterized phage-like protein YoqJ